MPETRLAAALNDTATAVQAELDRLIPVPVTLEARVHEAMRYALFAGGKRLRPFLVLASADLFSVPRAEALRVAAAMEMVHTYSLIHDDLPAMDDDDLRRGKPTCHRQFDEATAILAGDALQAMAFRILAEPATDPDPACPTSRSRMLSVRNRQLPPVASTIDATSSRSEPRTDITSSCAETESRSPRSIRCASIPPRRSWIHDATSGGSELRSERKVAMVAMGAAPRLRSRRLRNARVGSSDHWRSSSKSTSWWSPATRSKTASSTSIMA